jgi:hypothetical protein
MQERRYQVPWWMRLRLALARWLCLLAAGAFCAVGWLAAIYTATAAGLPRSLDTPVWVLLIALPPILLLLFCALLGCTSWVRLVAAFVLIVGTALPAFLVRPPGTLSPDWLARAPLLVPSFSAGVAIGFGWPLPRYRSPRTTAWGSGMRAAFWGAAGFALPGIALVGFELYFMVIAVPSCAGPTCFVQDINFAYLALVEGFTLIFGTLLALAGGAAGAMLRAE